MIHYNATITLFIDDCRWSEVRSGTDTELHQEAMDFLNTMTLKFIANNRITDPEEQDDIINEARYEITYDEEPFTEGYAVLEYDAVNPVFGIYKSLADAEEALYAECEAFAYETLMTGDPEDITGMEEWVYAEDYWWLMRDCASTFHIEEVPIYEN